MAKDWDQFPAASPVDVALQAEGVTGRAAEVARSIYEQESGSGKNTKTSNAGAVGGMQVVPATFKQVADKGWDINDPIDNARAGVRYVKMLDERGGGDPVLTAAGYYGGPGGQDKARKGIAVSDPRNPKAPNTLEYGQQVASRLAAKGGSAAPAAAPVAQASAADWDQFPVVEQQAAKPAAKPGAPAANRTVIEDLGRQLGLTVRAGVSGAAAIPAMMSDAVTGPINAGLDVVAGKGKGFRFQQAGQALSNVMTAAGVPQPENATERVVQDAAGAMAGAGGFVGAGKALAKTGGAVAQSVGKQLAAGPGLQVASAAAGSGAAGATREGGGGTGAQLAAGLVGGLTPGLGVPAGKAAVRGALRGGEAGRQRVASNIAAFEAAGTSPTLGQATEGRLARATESLLAKTPGGAGVIASRAQAQADDMAVAVQRLSDELAPGANAMNAGEAISKGINAFKQGVKATQQKLYANLDQHLPLDTPIQVPKTQAALKALNADIPGAPNISEFFKNAKIKGIDRALQADLEKAAVAGADDLAAQASTLPYQAIKKLRTLVGNEISDSNLVSDVPRSKWQALYGALSDDLGVAATKAGPEAEASWKWANQYTRSQMGRLEQLSSIVAKDAPEKVFAAAVAGSLEGDTVVKRVINALPKTERREVAAAVLQRLGRATPGQQNAMGDSFSSETFLTNLSKLSPASRKTLFGRTDVKGIEEQIGKFAKVAESRRDGGRVFANPSGTAPAAAQIAMSGGIGAGAATSMVTGNPLPLVGALAVPAAASGAARILTNPALPNFAAKQTVLRDGAAASMVGASARTGGTSEPAAEVVGPAVAAEDWDAVAPVVDLPPQGDTGALEVTPVAPALDGLQDLQPDQNQEVVDPADLPEGTVAALPEFRPDPAIGEDTSSQEQAVVLNEPELVTAAPPSTPSGPPPAARPDGTLALQGDPRELKATLVAAGIPARSLMLGKDGLIVGRTQAARVQEVIGEMLAQADAGQPATDQGPQTTAAELEPMIAGAAPEDAAMGQDQSQLAMAEQLAPPLPDSAQNQQVAQAEPAEVATENIAQATAPGLPGTPMEQINVQDPSVRPLGDAEAQAQTAADQTGSFGGVATAGAPTTDAGPGATEMASAGIGQTLHPVATRIRRLRDAGETEVAELMQQSHAKEQRLSSAPSELTAMQGLAPDLAFTQIPEFQQTYMQLRGAGTKPAEAAARAGMLAAVQTQGPSIGMPGKALSMLIEQMGTMPLEKVPGFAQRFTAALIDKGVLAPFEGVEQIAQLLEGARDASMNAMAESAYGAQG